VADPLCPGCDDTGMIEGFYCSCAAAESMKLRDARLMDRFLVVLIDADVVPAEPQQLELDMTERRHAHR
jgi:hypothetical protein